MSDGSREVYLADMSVCRPAGALSRGHREMTWRLVDYETEYGLKGVMAFADPELGAPGIELPLGVKGLHKIYLGINYTKSPYGYQKYGPYGNLDVKLTGEKGYRHVGAEGSQVEQPTVHGMGRAPKLGHGKFVPRSIQEVYWKTAELEGKSLMLRPPGEPYRTQHPGISNLSYVRLVPLTEEEVAFHSEIGPRGETRRLAFIYCTGNLSGHIDQSPSDYHPTNPDWFETEITPCLDSDFRILNLEVIRGSYCTFHTKTGDVGWPDHRWHDEWMDPLESFTRVAHDKGLKIFGAMRMIGTAYPTSRDPLSRAGFYWAHQEWAKRDRHGAPTGNLSVAFPEVRKYWLTLLKEVLEYGVDGVTVYFHRFRPFVLYEEPVVESFRVAFGEDPRELPEHEPRWVAHRASYTTRFLREIRELVSRYPGRELAVTFHGGPSDYESDPDGWHPIKDTCDVGTWIAKGLADYFMPTQKARPSLVREWAELGKGRVHIWPDLSSWGKWGADLIRQAEEYYEAGADGFCVWDAERQAPRISEWVVTSRLGHREMFDRLSRESSTYWRRVPLRYLNGLATMYSFNNYAHTDPLMASGSGDEK